MNSGLRKIHKYTWLLLVVVIPVLLFFSVKNLDFSPATNTPSFELKTSENKVLKMAENQYIKVSVLKQNGMETMEIILKSALKNPSSLVYIMNKDGGKGLYLGQISSLGIYNFNVKSPVEGVIIYDAIKETQITKLTL